MGPELQRLAGRVWLWPYHEDPALIQGSVAVIADDAGSVVVDAGNSPEVAGRIRSAIEAEGLPAARQLVYTHHHWDHTWGACAWPDVEVIGHEVGAEILAAEAERPWSDTYLREQVEADAALAVSMRARSRAMQGSWEEFRILPPSVTFEHALTLAGGVRLQHVGGRHADDSTVVAVPDSGVLLAGDCYYPPPLHRRGPDDGPDVGLVRELAETYSDYDWFVDSHDHPRSRADVRHFLGALEH